MGVRLSANTLMMASGKADTARRCRSSSRRVEKTSITSVVIETALGPSARLSMRKVFRTHPPPKKPSPVSGSHFIETLRSRRSLVPAYHPHVRARLLQIEARTARRALDETSHVRIGILRSCRRCRRSTMPSSATAPSCWWVGRPSAISMVGRPVAASTPRKSKACRARTAISRASYWVLGTSRRYRIVDTGQQMRPAGQARRFSLLTITSGPPP
jgi:hypothetical protein